MCSVRASKVKVTLLAVTTGLKAIGLEIVVIAVPLPNE
jgi:hypothetical protein